MKRVSGTTVHLDNCDEFYYGMYNYGSKKIFYNLIMIKRASKTLDIKFEKLLMLVISHEFIHKLLDLTEGKDTCVDWDNISVGLQEYGCN